MARSWSDAAQAAFDAYPWKSAAEKALERRETELVAPGDVVEVDDLPRAVRRSLQVRRAPGASAYAWHGESWQEATDAFARAVLTQALAAAHGKVAGAARLLKTTPRIVSYTARRLSLIPEPKTSKAKGNSHGSL